MTQYNPSRPFTMNNNITYLKVKNITNSQQWKICKIVNNQIIFFDSDRKRWLNSSFEPSHSYFKNSCVEVFEEEAARIEPDAFPKEVKENEIENVIPVYYKVNENERKNGDVWKIAKKVNGEVRGWSMKSKRWSSSGFIESDYYIKKNCTKIPEIEAAEIEPNAFGLKEYKRPKDE